MVIDIYLADSHDSHGNRLRPTGFNSWSNRTKILSHATTVSWF